MERYRHPRDAVQMTELIGNEPLMKPRVTQRDVARKAGVSHVTVSLALRGSPSSTEQTRNRIVKIADTLGYSPDPMLTALSSYRKQNRPEAYHANIAWLCTSSASGKFGDGRFWSVFQKAPRRAPGNLATC